MKKLIILGSTGSIGTQALDIVRNNPEEYMVVGLSCRGRISLLREQIIEFAPLYCCTGSREDADILSEEFKNVEFFWGEEGLVSIAEKECDMVLNSLLGISGFMPTYHAILKGRDIALANKETLVAGGEIIMREAAIRRVKIIPVDSEHSAVFQCLQGNEQNRIKKILLTASGGPFRGYTYEQLKKVTLSQALKHPNWAMGQKITIDSATMMNKGFEVIEARWLFDVKGNDIKVVVHPQSIIHSMVEFEDTSVMAQLGNPDMRLPISYAFSYPERKTLNLETLDLFRCGTLSFEEADTEVFTCLKLAYEALAAGGDAPAALNGANEVLVKLFLEEKIEFIQIQETLEKIMDGHQVTCNPDVQTILKTDKKARILAEKMVLENNL